MTIEITPDELGIILVALRQRQRDMLRVAETQFDPRQQSDDAEWRKKWSDAAADVARLLARINEPLTPQGGNRRELL